ncbi:hypothetical protein [Zobellia alginiliquefaciens]|uniref:hypothetical protein n=1 Tax=Zobellia alginiliquefaciens TaxID=3032586 RepID=UPI0023E4029E|nr:hypothetical protein [Zobellia alginiliquefaciens]
MRRKYIKYLNIWMFALILSIPIYFNAQKNEAPINILFVGNSFTYFWNMPHLVEAMSKTQGVPVQIQQSTVGGTNLMQHWKSEKGTVTRQLINDMKWDYVIFGDHSLSTIEAPKRFKKYSSKFAELVRSKGAEPIFFITWAYKSNPLMQNCITKGYMDLTKELNVRVFPVGPVFMKAKTLQPDLELYFDDKHPSSDGTYLIALTITKFLLDKSVKTVPNRLTTLDKDGKNLYLSFVRPTTGTFFRQLVEELDENF